MKMGGVQLGVWVWFKIYIKAINSDISKNPKCSKKDECDAPNTKLKIQPYTAPLKFIDTPKGCGKNLDVRVETFIPKHIKVRRALLEKKLLPGKKVSTG